MSNVISLDFSNVQDLTNLPAGKHVLKVKKYEQVTASTGSPMIKITFENAKGETGIDNFVLTESALWKLKSLMQALFRQNFTGAFNFDLDTMIGRTCTAVAKEEEYVKQDGTPSIRIALDNYMPVNDADAMGVTPNAPVQTTAPVPPVAPVQPQVVAQPQPAVAPAQAVPPVQPAYNAPAQAVVQPQAVPQQQVVTPVQPQVQPQQVVTPQPQVVAQPQPAVAPAQPTQAPATPVAKRPWEM